MNSDPDFDQVNIEEYGAKELVKSITDPSELLHIMLEECHPVAKTAAAEKVLKMWKDGTGGVTLHHLVYIGDHGDEPYRSQANDILNNRTC